MVARGPTEGEGRALVAHGQRDGVGPGPRAVQHGLPAPRRAVRVRVEAASRLGHGLDLAQVLDVVHQFQRVDGVEDRARRRVHRVAPVFDFHVRREEGRFCAFQPFGHFGVVGGRRAVELVQGLLDDGQGLQRGEQGQEAQEWHLALQCWQ